MNTLVFMRQINFVHLKFWILRYHYSYFTLYISSPFLKIRTACLNWNLKNIFFTNYTLVDFKMNVKNIQSYFGDFLGYLVGGFFCLHVSKGCWTQRALLIYFYFFYKNKVLWFHWIFLIDKFECIYDKFTRYTQISLYHAVVRFVILFFLYFFMNCSFINQ